jgi:predicted metalloenzyme YecM
MDWNIDNFLEKLFEKIVSTGIDIKILKLDHIAYSVSSSEEYEALLPEFKAKGELVREAIIGDRRVAVLELEEPLVWKSQTINAVELIEPKADEEPFSGWEHAEFLVNNYDEFMAKYPNLNWITDSKDRVEFSRIKLQLGDGLEVKFLTTPLLKSATN